MKTPGRDRSSPTDEPLIGIACSEIRPAVTLRRIPESEPQSTELALSIKYVEAVESAGGVPCVIPPMSRAHVGQLVGRFDGILLPGGPDIDPASYGELPHEKLGGTSTDLDQLQFEVARSALEFDLPLLAICRGMQLLNVTLGGSLIQHLPDETGSNLRHRQSTSSREASHPITIRSPSQIGEIIGRSELEVNSFHHQAVKSLGVGVEPTAEAPDGTIEAVEIQSATFAIGVQWHAELMAERTFEATLFSALIEQASGHSRAP